MATKKKLIRISTVPLSLNIFCRGLLSELAADYDTVAICSPGDGFDEIAPREGVRTIAVPMKRAISPLSDLKSLVRLIKILRREKPDIIHSITPKAGLLAMVAARVAGVPLRIHTFTGLVFPTAKGFRRRLLMFTDRLTSFYATHIIPEGEGVMNDLYAFGITRKPMRVLGNGNIRGIDLTFYTRTPELIDEAEGIRRTLSIPPEAFVFIFAGRIVADKGIRELITAFESLAGHNPSVHLLLIGDTEPESDPLDYSTVSAMRALCASGRLSVVGWQDDIRPWYAAADALVFPSYREGFPNVVIEAGAMSLPSIVTDINGSREIIQNMVNGTIIPAHDAEALLAAMSTFAQQRELTARLASRARDMVASRYEQTFVRNCLKDFYRQCCNDLNSDISETQMPVDMADGGVG